MNIGELGHFVNALCTKDSVILCFQNGMRCIRNTNENFNKVKSLIITGDINGALEAIDPKIFLEKHSSGKFYFIGDDIYLREDDKIPMPKALGQRILTFAKQQIDFDPLIKFWERLKDNPSETAKQGLYTFLERHNIPFTEEGCFLAYKAIREDYTDCRTGTIYNHVGNVVSMPRDQVNPDPEMTCSTGLHIACFDYASKFYKKKGKLVLLKIDPSDVVAVPNDYNAAKIRVCKYYVVEEASEEIKDVLIKDRDLSPVPAPSTVDSWGEDIDNEEGGQEWQEWFDLPAFVDHQNEENTENEMNAEEEKDWIIEKEISSRIVSLSSEGRLRISSEYIMELGYLSGDEIPLFFKNQDHDEGFIEIPDVADVPYDVQPDATYVVSSKGAIRISKRVLEAADLWRFPAKVSLLDRNGKKSVQVS